MSEIHQVYQSNLKELQQQETGLAKSDRSMSILRLVLAVSFLILTYKWLTTSSLLLGLSLAVLAIAFGLIVKRHSNIRWKLKLIQQKRAINEKELAYHQTGELAFEDGEQFKEADHAYAYDLDFLGKGSIYHLINRTATVKGKEALAKGLLTILPKRKIEEVQRAVKELSESLAWRQHFQALAGLYPDDEDRVERLMKWTEAKSKPQSKITRVLSYILPIATVILLLLYLIQSNDLAGRIGGLLALVNLGILATKSLAIKEELGATTEIEKTLKQYSFLLEEIEQHTFDSELLIELRSKLTGNNTKASKAIHSLSLLFGRLEHVSNAFASPFLNGLLQYHIHVLHGLNQWRSTHGSSVLAWLEVIGEVEKLNSLAAFKYNHPASTFPTISESDPISFENLGHPLLKDGGVRNSVDFAETRFFILTGSNMSGKSTFLRALGVNMVLAGVGAPVLATSATVKPIPVLVSMRLSDSITDSESYFYAEVKRLRYIMQELNNTECFVLLDEILRGTNSDDKRNGTVEVIRKMTELNAIGGIATHDLEVCNITNEYPTVLSNRRFEVEIINDELQFDYKLREGICENKSASFIMKKMNVI